MSNNTVQFKNTDDFKTFIPLIANQIIKSGNGEPGIYNMINVQNFGRVNKHYDPEEVYTREREFDHAIGVNPCGEIPLESYELCNLAEVFPSKCVDQEGNFNQEIFYKAIEYATVYASIVSLLPTHSPDTNKIIAKNHRIGVGLSGTVLISERIGYSGLIDLLKSGYRKVRSVNNWIMDMAGVPRSIRVTTIKPSGTISKLAGVPEGIHFPIENRYIIRRIRIAKNSELVPHLINSNVPFEQDNYADNTLVFSFPIDQGPTRSLKEVSMWEQLKMAELFQRWWSDNSVSVTINYDAEEAKSLESAISSSISNIKTLSFAPKSDIKYTQAPVEAITREEYLELKKKIGIIDLKGFKEHKQVDTSAPVYCDGDKCALGQ
jgi:ribonucleoside-diphosphate reductase alpha chain